eukprot:CAMPEP_0185580694 /NCGR_PEP_ID=MMETSP0434-20130131/17472_1 /TAXON_ID=626734 ORGANISM="Favella taraikaensis, Strain Fe Narragansett Bay" /NCGR_SAMPLE_ID=MMETSP0434 /ASSEMBLY_ACC=CAM_ASM_000379 /LENGTH=74 /DNA_ID=CAMNT_0028199033 /DNA_START=1061 /DNA_END=1285 /DNA_ORIENTATION=+
MSQSALHENTVTFLADRGMTERFEIIKTKPNAIKSLEAAKVLTEARKQLYGSVAELKKHFVAQLDSDFASANDC